MKQATKPGNFKILIHEILLPEKGVLAFYAVIDMTVMAFNGAMERTESLSEGYQVLIFTIRRCK